jgi:hypothetical protein
MSAGRAIKVRVTADVSVAGAKAAARQVAGPAR